VTSPRRLPVVPELRCAIEQRGFNAVIHLNGELDVVTAPVLRTTFLKSLANEPELIVIDLAGVRLVEEVALTIFPSLARHAAAWPGSPVVLAAARTPLVEALRRSAVCRYLPLYRTSAEAIGRAPRQPSFICLRRRLEPVPAATAVARELVDDACKSWDQTELSDIAQLVVTELVSNAIRHARTSMELSISLRERHLHLSVRDQSLFPPRRGGADDPVQEDGRGLLVVEALTSAWGYTPTRDGKVVWATLRAHRNGVR
jgi:anti-anti-sigma factor